MFEKCKAEKKGENLSLNCLWRYTNLFNLTKISDYVSIQINYEPESICYCPMFSSELCKFILKVWKTQGITQEFNNCPLIAKSKNDWECSASVLS